MKVTVRDGSGSGRCLPVERVRRDSRKRDRHRRAVLGPCCRSNGGLGREGGRALAPRDLTTRVAVRTFLTGQEAACSMSRRIWRFDERVGERP